MEPMMRDMKEMKEEQVKKDDIKDVVEEIIENKVTGRLDTLERDTKKLQTSSKTICRETERLSKRVDELEKKNTKPQREPAQKRPKSDKWQLSSAFIQARKSIRFTPCAATEMAVRNFMEKEMKMDRATCEAIEITSVKAFTERKKINRPQKERAIALFSSIDERDAVFSYATELENGNSVDIVIPDHLKTEAMKLDHFAYKYRMRSREKSQGKKDEEARTQLRLDTMREGLILGIRDKKAAEWVFF